MIEHEINEQIGSSIQTLGRQPHEDTDMTNIDPTNRMGTGDVSMRTVPLADCRINTKLVYFHRRISFRYLSVSLRTGVSLCWKFEDSTMSLLGKVIIVTGAGSGIGKATALLLGDEKAHVALFDINPSIFDIEAQIMSSGGSALAIKVDVGSSSEVNTATKSVVDAFGPIDGKPKHLQSRSV